MQTPQKNAWIVIVVGTMVAVPAVATSFAAMRDALIVDARSGDVFHATRNADKRTWSEPVRVNSEAGSGATCARTALLLARQDAGPVCMLDGNFGAKQLTSFYFPDKAPQPKGVGSFSREHCVPVEDNLWLAGDWTATGLPATIEGAIRSGARAAALAAK